MSTCILGLSFDYHDAAAALIVDGALVAAAQEERFSRIKNDPGFPRNAIQFCLSRAGISGTDLDAVCYYEDTELKFQRLHDCAMAGGDAAAAETFLSAVVREWLQLGKFEPEARIVDALGVPATRIRRHAHHASHAASAYHASGFGPATVVTLDGVGEFETGTAWRADAGGLEQILSVRYPDSLGMVYSAVTDFLGFEVNEGEYKVMGLAPYGTPRHAEAFRDLFELTADGGFRVDQAPFNFAVPDGRLYTGGFVDRFGDPATESWDALSRRGPDDGEFRRLADIAASLQAATEQVIGHVVGTAADRTGHAAVCLAGGVALNSVANGRLRRARQAPMYVQPAAGDAGGALGAALLGARDLGLPLRDPAGSRTDLGRAFDDREIERALARSGHAVEAAESEEALVAATAGRLADGQVVGWFQGRSEWGPRSLGFRSILASPRSADMRDRVNESIKFREVFRPFAPSVPEERADRYFDLPPRFGDTDPEFAMLAVCPVRPDRRPEIPAVVHVDGSARVHLVSRRLNPLFHRLLGAFGDRAGVPVLMNTSFNLRGEPIVDSPADALSTFERSGLDALVIGRFTVAKRAG